MLRPGQGPQTSLIISESLRLSESAWRDGGLKLRSWLGDLDSNQD